MRAPLALLAVVVAVAVFSPRGVSGESSDPTVTDLLDLPPLNDKQLEELAEGAKLSPWSKVSVDEYGLKGPMALSDKARRELLETPAAATTSEIQQTTSSSSSEGDDDEESQQQQQQQQQDVVALEPVEDDGADDNGVGLDEKSAPTDLIDVNPSALIPSLNTKQFNDIRAALSTLRRKLIPLHRRICPRGARFSRVCIDRRRANARILHSVVRRGCGEGRRGGKCARVVRRCPRHKPRCSNSRAAERRSACSQGLCTPGRATLRRISRRYLLLRDTYSRLYIRYAMLLAKFYKRKFRTLARVFIETVKRLKWELKQAQDYNKRLIANLASLRAASKNMRQQTARVHADQKNRLKSLQNTHLAHLAAAARSVSEVRAELLREMSETAKLQQQLDDLNARVRGEEATRARHAAAKAAVAAAKDSLAGNTGNLVRQIANVQAQLDNSRARAEQLRRLRDELLKRQQLLQASIEQLKADADANNRAQQRIQTSYNDLLNQFNRIRDSQMSAQDAQNQILATLRNQIQVQAQRCVPDACGICNGDESSCALTRSAGSCYSVGDPHFRSFDGNYFDFQVDGQFVLLKHGNPVNFEIQTLQRLAHGCPWQPRLNKGVAVRGGRNVVVMYTDWGTQVMIVNGVRTNIPQNVWQRIGPGFLVYRYHNAHAIFRYQNRLNQVVTTQLTITHWTYGAFTSVDINAPWQWSSGRSLWGLCGNFNAWSGDDGLFIGRNWGRLFYVTNTANDMFVNPGRRTVDIELVDFAPEDIEKEKALDKLNGVRGTEDLEEYAGEDLQAPALDVSPAGNNNSTGNANGLPPKGGAAKTSLGVATPEMVAIARRRCRGSHGEVRKQCEFDVLQGLPARAARKGFDAQNILANENLLKRCMAVNAHSFAVVPDAAIRAEETRKEGFSYSFWFSPSSILAKRCVLLEKGANFFVTQNGGDIAVGAGRASCSARGVLVSSKWTAVTISVHHSGSLHVFINSQLACQDNVKGGIARNTEDLLVGGGDSTDTCAGRVAHLYYIPQTVTAKEASVHGRLSPFACLRSKSSSSNDGANTTSLLEESEEEYEDENENADNDDDLSADDDLMSDEE